jgi:hypothetical protein
MIKGSTLIEENIMSRLNQFYGQISKQASMDSFVICPSLFVQGLTLEQLAAMQQLYKSAYEKAWKELNGKGLDEFDMGSGI